jgi:hypothetical protein
MSPFDSYSQKAMCVDNYQSPPPPTITTTATHTNSVPYATTMYNKYDGMNVYATNVNTYNYAYNNQQTNIYNHYM